LGSFLLGIVRNERDRERKTERGGGKGESYELRSVQIAKKAEKRAQRHQDESRDGRGGGMRLSGRCSW